MRSLMVLLLVMAVAGCGDGDATETGPTEQFTQGGVSMEPTVKAGQVVTVRKVPARMRHGAAMSSCSVPPAAAWVTIRPRYSNASSRSAARPSPAAIRRAGDDRR